MSAVFEGASLIAGGESPAAVYQRRIEGFRAVMARLRRWDTAIVWARTVVFLGAVAIAVLVVRSDLATRWLLAPALLFAGLVVVHGRVLEHHGRLGAAVSLCEDGIDRISDRWAGKGDPGAPFQAAAEAHLYAADLDLFGKGGLYELVSVARTPIGQATLAAWLQAPASPAVARARQGAVAELSSMIDLRQDLALVAATVRTEVREEALMSWARDGWIPSGNADGVGAVVAAAPAAAAVNEPLSFAIGPWRLALAAIALVTVATGVLGLTGVVGPRPFIAAFLVGWSMSLHLRKAIARILVGLDHRADELKSLASLMARVERESFRSPALRDLRQALETEGVAPSRRIAQLRRLVDLIEARRNQIAAILMAPLHATAQLALAIEAWRRATGPAVLRWMSAMGQLEALTSLATFHFEHPEYPFPTVVDGPAAAVAPPLFESEALGHPLIPAARRVVNDLQLGGERRLLIVSGSNMSGKSTLLRTVGVNVVLALAGAPVCARRLTLSPVTLGATLRINDSLQAGKSRFYAELTRLKSIVDRAGGAPPLMFLLDEILHGTNSHDRRIGAEAIIRGLVARGAVGLVTTHDLALAEVAEAMGARAANVHFEDHLADGVMTFDFRMKPGVVRKSNALELMRAIGLEV